ncbi:Uncharacterized protein OBRU01_21141, partial [Operophtera brumata]
MSIDQSPLVPIKPQVLNNSAFIKNIHNRSSFCGVSPSSGTFKTFAVNRKSWSGNVTLPLQQFAPEGEPPQLATFRSGTGTFPRNRERRVARHKYPCRSHYNNFVWTSLKAATDAVPWDVTPGNGILDRFL